jgi:hypothetical protein
MQNRFLLILILFIICTMAKAQEPDSELPYDQIPDAPETYSQGSIVARMVDGLGFRYYWATEGLRKEDLQFKPGVDSRTSEETIDHILGLSNVILNSALHKENEGLDTSGFNFEQKRRITLENLKTAADIFRKSNDLSEFTVVFKRQDASSEFPFWNQINGPISDAIWHCGQVVSFRRSSGNPFNSKVSVFMGKLND